MAKVNRRVFLASGAATALALVDGRADFGLSKPRASDGSQSKDMITPAAQRAIDRGLDFLQRGQQPDGSFGERHQYKGNVAITSLAALAMMAGGHQPGRGAKGEVVSKALDFVLDPRVRHTNIYPGFLYNKTTGSPHGPMYSHGFGTLFLAEVYGMISNRDQQKRVREALKEAVQLIIKSQSQEGGWRYHPNSKDADISVTICQIMALRAARNVGIAVEADVVKKCVEYVKSCQTLDGGFKYMKQGGHAAFARTAAGVVALYSAGVYKGPEVEKGLEYLMKCKPGQERGLGGQRQIVEQHYFYGHYYAAQAMWTAGGNYWTEWFPAIREELINRAERLGNGGAWSDSICSHYATAMACIILQIPNNYLPILQK